MYICNPDVHVNYTGIATSHRDSLMACFSLGNYINNAPCLLLVAGSEGSLIDRISPLHFTHLGHFTSHGVSTAHSNITPHFF